MDLNKSLEIPEDKDIYSVILHNVTQTNFYQIKFPQTIIHLTLNGKMTDLIIPDGIENIECCNMGLHTVHINESLEFLECCDNELETIQLTKNILCVNVRNNKITTVTCREKLEQLVCLDIVNNRVTDLDIELPQEKMGELCISGNDNIKIKNITFVFADDVTCNFIGGDFLSVYDIEHYIYHEYLRKRLYILSSLGENYIDVKAIKDDDYFFDTLKKLCPDTWKKY